MVIDRIARRGDWHKLEGLYYPSGCDRCIFRGVSHRIDHAPAVLDGLTEPRSTMARILTTYGEWIRWLIILIAIGAFWVGNSKATYATKEDVQDAVNPVQKSVERLSTRVADMHESLAVIAAKSADDERRDKLIEQLDQRVRVLEQTTAASAAQPAPTGRITINRP